MTEGLAEIIVATMGAYVAIGLLFAAVFVTWGVSRLDPGARQTTIAFRLLILPGSMALWPIVAACWARRTK